VRVHGDCGVAVLYVSDELNQVAGVRGDAVALHGDLRPPTAQPHVAAGKVVGARRSLDDATLPVHVVDLEYAFAGLAGRGGRGCGFGRRRGLGLRGGLLPRRLGLSRWLSLGKHWRPQEHQQSADPRADPHPEWSEGLSHRWVSCSWPGNSIPLPATPRGLSVTTFRKSGSERKLLPSRCSASRSKEKRRSVEMVLLALS